MSVSEIFKETKKSLDGKWGIAIAAFLVYLIITLGMQAIPVIGNIASLALSGPLAVGLCIFNLALIRNQNPSISLLFKGFDLFLPSMWTYLAIILIVFLGSLIFGGFLIISLMPYTDLASLENIEPEELYHLLFNGAPLAVILIFFIIAFLFHLHISQAYFLVAEKKIGGFKPLGLSSKIMKGHKMSLFIILLVFGLASAILLTITFGFGIIVIGPFTLAALAIFYDKINPQENYESNNLDLS
ncbi:DUF975 family protein [Aureibacter tunicatorum]|uniref:Membrane protein n=1 Tax=Aureibacter tunicatorum TaxID=866807 RepID=A0AAE3XRI2_9BACT|nr:DUF975 family protein [Aureibacter tunicatorum]MDR6240571.1 putative membrane protein [Aureibacter tunicatorum]BDD06568.1 membrane protein [Aureibacter tunicatorum]